MVDSNFIFRQLNFEKSEMLTRISRVVVGRSGPYSILLSRGIPDYVAGRRAQSAHYSPRKSQNTSKTGPSVIRPGLKPLCPTPPTNFRIRANTVPPSIGDPLWVIPHPYWWVVTRRVGTSYRLFDFQKHPSKKACDSSFF